MSKSRKRGRTLSKQMLKLLDEYLLEHHVEEWDPDAVTDWAIRTNRYHRTPMSVAQQCRRDLVKACREAHHIDPQGREVRSMHPIRVPMGEKQMSIWADIRTAKPQHMRISLSQRRRAILADCKQHKTDLESYNDNNIHSAKLPLFDYNFNPDLEEGDFPSEYPLDKPPTIN